MAAMREVRALSAPRKAGLVGLGGSSRRSLIGISSSRFVKSVGGVESPGRFCMRELAEIP